MLEVYLIRTLMFHSFRLFQRFQVPNSLKDFQPISLVEGIYKIIAKVLANRLNLQSSANYGDSKISSRCRKGKTYVM
jgi:hypothetical protein